MVVKRSKTYNDVLGSVLSSLESDAFNHRQLKTVIRRTPISRHGLATKQLEPQTGDFLAQ
jgi:hypothetical protein